MKEQMTLERQYEEETGLSPEHIWGSGHYTQGFIDWLKSSIREEEERATGWYNKWFQVNMKTKEMLDESRWILITERQPDNFHDVYVSDFTRVTIAYLNGGGKFLFGVRDEHMNVKVWKEIIVPSAPQGESK